MSHVLLTQVLRDIHLAETAAALDTVRLVAISKTQTPAAISALAHAGQRAFGENYVQEAAAKITVLAPLALEWHLVGHLQSNKVKQAAVLFDWIQTIDRPKLIPLLAKARPAKREPLNVLIQVNIDHDKNKHGCSPDQVAVLAHAIATEPRLCLRGLMTIPSLPADQRGAPFTAMRDLYQQLQANYSTVDTLSMGMSADFQLAIHHGATLVRIGTALFGERTSPPPSAP